MDKSWKLNNWKTKSKQNVKNSDLWKELDKLDEFHTIEWNWVKGHSGNKYNDEVDMLARSEAESI